jgi:HEAT repeat protein
VLDLTNAIRSEEDPIIRAEIITTLAHYDGSTVDRVLKAALQDPDPDVRVAACRAWGRRGGSVAIELLTTAMTSDVEIDVRLAAAKALGRLKDPAAVAPLGKLLEDPDPAMQYAAASALREVTGQDFGADLNQWRQYVKGENPRPAGPTSVAERLRHMF